ncbi:MAG: GspH/FimT family pseudopilin [Halioglobus sp.]
MLVEKVGVARMHVIGIMEKNRHTGFTLVELMIALVVAAVLMQVVAPGFQKMIKDNHVKSEVFALRAALNTARSEALTRRQRVIVCAGNPADGCSAAGANWVDGFIAFTDPDNDSDYTAPATVNDDDLIVVHQSDSPDYVNVWFESTDASDRITFRQQGYTTTTASFEVCDDRKLEDARGIIITAIGHVRAATDTDDDDIRNDHGDDNFDCVEPAPP